MSVCFSNGVVSTAEEGGEQKAYTDRFERMRKIEETHSFPEDLLYCSVSYV